MKTKVISAAALAALSLMFAGCHSVPPGTERGPHGTIAYYVSVDATPPGALIETNGVVVTNTPVTLKIFGDKDGTFHDFGYDFFVIRALPLTTNQFIQFRWFGTGRHWGQEDRIPKSIYLDLNQRPPENPGYPAAAYPYPYSGPPGYYPPPGYYYGPPYYGPPYYYGPGVRFYFGPRYRRW